MRITEITYDNWKGISERVQLGTLNYFVGQTGTGKTARLWGPGYAVLGKTPLGGTNDQTAQIVGTSGGSVKLTLDDGFAWTRRIVRDHQANTVSQEVVIDGRGGGTLSGQNALVAERVGKFAEMFDLNELLALSPDRRRKRILELCSASMGEQAIDDADVASRLMLCVLGDKLGRETVHTHCEATLRKTPMELTREERITVATALLPKLDERFREILSTAMQAVRGELRDDLASGLAAAIEKADGQKNYTKQQRDRAHGTAQEIARRKADLQVPAKNVEELRQSRDQLQADRNHIADQIKLQEGKGTARTSLEQQLKDLAAGLKGAQDALAQHQEAKGAAYEGEAPSALEAAAQSIEDGLTVPADPTSPLLAEQKAVQSTLARLDRELYEARQAEHNARQHAGRINGQIQAFETSDRARLMAAANAFHVWVQEAEVAALLEAWAPLYAAITTTCECAELPELRQQKPGADASLLAATELVRGIEEQIAGQQTTLNELSMRIEAVRKEHADAQAQYQERLQEAHRLRRRALEGRSRRESWEHTTQFLQTDIAHKTNALVTAERRLNELDSAGGHVPTEDLQAQLARFDEQIAKANLEIDAKVRYAALEKELHACGVQAEQEGAAHEVWKAIGTALRELREGLMRALVAPLLDAANELLMVAKPGYQTYCRLANERGTAICEFGWTDGLRQTPLPALSGGETVLFGAALAYALVKVKAPPLRLLILEIAEADPDTSARLMAGLEAVAPNLSNVLVASCHPIVPSMAWTVINCEPALQAVA